MIALPRSEPSQSVPIVAVEGGMTSANGAPRFVITTDRPVRRTRSNTSRQVALKCETEIAVPVRLDMAEDYNGQLV